MIRRLAVSLIAVLLAVGVTPPEREAAAETYVLQIDMFGSEEVPAVQTTAYGFVRFFFNDDRTAADYTVDVKGISNNLVLGADIHRGARGVNGPAVRHLADGGFIVTAGRMSFSEQDFEEIRAGQWYVSLKSSEHPQGAMRGQMFLPADFFPAPAPQEVAAPVRAAPQPAAPQPAAGSGQVIRPPSTGDGGLVR